MTALVLLAGLTSAACGASWENVTPPGRFERLDLEGIILGPLDAPDGTAYLGSRSGYQDLETFARDAEELIHLKDDGFLTGHLAVFFPESFASADGPGSRLTTQSVIVQGITGLFRSSRGAESALVRFVGDLRDRQLPDAADIRSGDLGDHAFALEGETPDGSHVLIYAWRVDNLVLALSGSGRIDARLVRSIADLIDDRAARA